MDDTTISADNDDCIYNKIDENGNAPLHNVVTWHNSLSVTKLFVLQGANVNIRNKQGMTPFDVAKEHGNLATAKYLARQMNGEDFAPAHPTPSLANDKTTIDKNGTTPDSSALFEAIRNNQFDTVKSLIKQGVDTEAKTGGPLRLAARDNRRIIACLLIEAGVEIDPCDACGNTPLHIAAAYGHTETAHALIDAEANLTAKDKNGKTPLHLAALHKKDKTVQMLLEAGADPKAKDGYGRTPLHDAARSRDAASILLLLAKGADTEIGDDRGKTALDYARGIGDAIVY